MAQAGVQAIAYIPLRDDAGVFGVLGLGTFARSEANTLLDRLPAMGALGAVASSRLSVAVRRTMAKAGANRDIHGLIAGRAFHPVFQPIVDLRTGETLGFEALTRFDNGTRPDVQFQRAASLGLGADLEVVTLEAAIAAARALPAGAYLTLNVSPDTALQPGVLARVLAAADRPVVLEITEHALIDDYAGLRAMARSLPVPARLAVDDAGAGFASLRHVLELAPDIVKIDGTIVAGIDRDPARQALVAGLRFFASRRGIQLIAEGIETAPELAALTSLAVPLGQGFLLGRPTLASLFTPSPIPLPPSGVTATGRTNGASHPDGNGAPAGRAAGAARRLAGGRRRTTGAASPRPADPSAALTDPTGALTRHLAFDALIDQPPGA
jgi:EAL domain-containing protein (putative c-di-GMP-specific phosphodiesterase class I)